MVQKYPARAHTAKVVEALGKLVPDELRHQMHGIIVQAAPVMFRHDTDRELPYHQEANFSYLSGCPIPTASALIMFGYASPEESTQDPKIHHQLLIPPADPLETMWSVAPPTLEEARERFDSDYIAYSHELPQSLQKAMWVAQDMPPGRTIMLHTLPDTLDYPALPPSVLDVFKGETFVQNTEYLFPALHIARLTKDEFEIDLIRTANQISSAAHEVVMRELGKHAKGRAEGEAYVQGRRSRRIQPERWEVESENDAEALLTAVCTRAGSAHQAYLPIVASGTRASTLHYVCNDRLFPSTAIPRPPGDQTFTPRQPGRGCCGSDEHQHEQDTEGYHDGAFEPQVLLIDAGCEWKEYASDITRVMPIGNGGRFTPRAAEIYDLVLSMQKECEALVTPGAHWDALHLHAHEVLIRGFLSLGIFKGTEDDILASGVTAAFLPHGLGHSLGLDVHDSRQYLVTNTHDADFETKASMKLFKYLRIRRRLEKGMVLTVEPGCYFAPQLMEEHGVWTSPFVVPGRLKEFTSVGGVRLEDVVVVREGKCENLTTVGREREWVERICSGGIWGINHIVE